MGTFCSLPLALRKAKKSLNVIRACDAETKDNKTSRRTDRAQAGKDVYLSKKEQKSTAIHNHTDGYNHPYYCLIYLLFRRNMKVF